MSEKKEFSGLGFKKKLAHLFSKNYWVSFAILVGISFIVFRNLFAAIFFGLILFLIVGHQLFGKSQVAKDNADGAGSVLAFYDEHFAILMAAILKADARVDDRQMAYIKDRVEREYFKRDGEKILRRIRFYLTKEQLDLRNVYIEIRENYHYGVKVQLLHIVVSLAVIDGIMAPGEHRLLMDYCKGAGVPHKTLDAILAMFRFKFEHAQNEQKKTKTIRASQIEDAYKILEVESTASNEQIKKSYKRLAKLYHPDRLIHENEVVQKMGSDKFKIIVNAYDLLCKKRGIV